MPNDVGFRLHLLVIAATLNCMALSAREHPIVRQGDELINYNDPQNFNDYFALADEFARGAKLNGFLPAQPTCFNTLKDFLNKWNTTSMNTTEEQWLTETYDTLRVYSKIISDQFAPAYLNCHLMVVDGYDYYLSEKKVFKDWNSYSQAFLQNMVGQLISINDIITKVQAATESGNNAQVLNYYGKAFYLLMQVEPLELGAFEEHNQFSQNVQLLAEMI